MTRVVAPLIVLALVSSIFVVFRLKQDPCEPSYAQAGQEASESLFLRHLERNRPATLQDHKIDLKRYGVDHLIPNEKYFFFLPYEGTVNQLYSLVKAIHVATKLKRTLIVPPLMASKHDKNRQVNADWRHFLDFSNIFLDSKICKIRWMNEGMVPLLKEMLSEDGAECVAFGRWEEWWSNGLPSINFVLRYNLSSSMRTRYLGRSRPLWTEAFPQSNPARLMCALNLFHMVSITSHPAYIEMVNFSDNVLRTAWSFLGSVGIGNERYAMLHWRRGDFVHACTKNKNATACWPLEQTLWSTMDAIHRDTGIEAMVIGTNEEDEGLVLGNAGGHSYDIFRSHLPWSGGDEEWDQFAPVFMDICLMTFSDYFVGNQYSTISRLARLKRNQLGITNSHTF